MQAFINLEVEKQDAPKPFLRWAGGKRWFTKHIDLLAPNFKFDNYHEPFLGSGVIFFHFQPKRSSFLSDLNSELIDTYLSVQQDVEKVIDELKSFENTCESYYKIRDSNFRSDYKRAARFIFLNQTSFNGIYRVNLKGKYNVPYGFRKTEIFSDKNLRLVSYLLSHSEIKSCDFETCKPFISKNDLVFLDPPYTVTHNDNGFIKYNQKLFSLEDQYRLSDFVDEIKAKGAYYILTNAAHKKIEEIFDKGDKKIKLKRASLIGGLNAKREKYEEIIFTNIL